MSRLSQGSHRTVGTAVIAFLMTAIIGSVHLVRHFASLAGNPEGFPASLISKGKVEVLEQWLYLSLAAFLSTLFFAAAFEYAYQTRKRWISVLLVPTSIITLFFAGAVAYVPYSNYIAEGWLINLGYSPRVPFLTGVVALFFGLVWRRRSTKTD